MITFAEIRHIYSDQMAEMLIGKSEMFKMGFNNGSLSSKLEEGGDIFLAHLSSDYEIGFREGYYFARYKIGKYEGK